jgi:hypothetical protein
MGDDAPWLFRLNEQFEVERKIQIGDISLAVDGKIPKSRKTDLEAMAAFGKELLLFGSGAKSPERDVLIRLDPEQPRAVKKYLLTEFYDHLCLQAGITRKELNLEAAAVMGETLLLFNRGKNLIFTMNVHAFLEYASAKKEAPAIELFSVNLPSLQGIEAGFSGATATPDEQQVVFTASVENTPDWIADGEVSGSFVGIFPLVDLKDGLSPQYAVIKDEKNNPLRIKAESVAIHGVTDTCSLSLLIVTDSDGSESEMLQGVLVR